MRHAMLAALGLMVGLMLCAGGCAPMDWEQGGERPGGTQALDVALPSNSMYLFENNDFQGSVSRIQGVTLHPHVALNDVELRSGNMSSLRWNLPPGVLVMFYDPAGPGGDQMSVWGSGQDNAVIKWDFNDKVSRWTWYHVGGETAEQAAGVSARPLGTKPLVSTMSPGTVELYEDRDLRGSLMSLVPGERPQAQRNALLSFNDKVSSLRWNLPPGVVVVFYDNVDGTGKQYAIWGSGQTSLVPFTFNDKASSWAWYDVGRPGMR